MLLAWRFAALGGLAVGLLAAPLLAGRAGPPAGALALGVALAAALAAVRPAGSRRGAWAWISAVAVLAALIGATFGAQRVRAIDAGAYAGRPGQLLTVTGTVAAVPRRDRGMIRVRLDTRDGRIALVAPQPERELHVGREVEATGTLREPEPWLAGALRIQGVRRVLAARQILPTGRRRGGIAGAFDAVRDRAQAALEQGMRPPEAELARGFVLGQDDRIAPSTVDDFRRSGLAHLLAVSGQNVLLLAILAAPILAVLGVSLRVRLLCLLALIAIYVPVTGAGPSIQRAGVMGAAGVVALLAGRPTHRWYAVLLAAVLTLGLNPRAAADVGWQLSFAAVIGILLWSQPLSGVLAAALGARRATALDWRRALADGAAVTIAATLATAPLSAHHFDVLPIAALPANLLALPAVAPVMWAGMLSAAAGQLAWMPVEPLNALAGLLIAYIAQVAHWLAAPSWALAPVGLAGVGSLVAVYAAMLTAGALAMRLARRRRGLAVRGVHAMAPATRTARSAPAIPTALAALAIFFTVAALAVAPAIVGPRADTVAALPRESQPGADAAAAAGPSRLEVSFLDVGQGDSILLDSHPGGAVLIDSGPPGAGVPEKLADRGVERLAAIVATHDQLDHSGATGEVVERIPTAAFLHGGAGPRLRATATSAGARSTRLEAGSVARFGALRLETLWPPARRAPQASGDVSGDPNDRSLVLLARWGRFEALLTGDAEAAVAPVDAGVVDVLKVAHHGSADEGLAALLERSRPRLAVISVGDSNSFGHPTAETLEDLSDARVPVLRTDLSGDIDVEVSEDGFVVRP